MGTLVLEEPDQVGLNIDTALLGRPDDAQESGPALGPTDASSEQRCISELGVALELPLGAIVVEGQLGDVDKAGEPVPMRQGVAHHLADRVGRRELKGQDVVKP